MVCSRTNSITGEEERKQRAKEWLLSVLAQVWVMSDDDWVHIMFYSAYGAKRRITRGNYQRVA
jgi:hypothetical protein